MKLYKLRGLGTCEDVRRAKEILETGNFWFARFYELNDPMEGVFKVAEEEGPDELVAQLFAEKSQYGICSFSRQEGFEMPEMWGYYANGFKGMAVEVEVPEGLDLRKVQYDDNLLIPRHPKDIAEILPLLSTKSTAWDREHEYRVLRKFGLGEQHAGKILAVHFGDPYGGLVNSTEILKANRSLQEYLLVRDCLKAVAKRRGILTSRVAVRGRKVVSENWP